MSGFNVNADELREFANRLDHHRSAAAELAGVVERADVGNKSWGVVGLWAKESYTQTLNDLKDMFTAMQDGLESGAQKFRDTAQGYADQEEALKKILDGIQIDRG